MPTNIAAFEVSICDQDLELNVLGAVINDPDCLDLALQHHLTGQDFFFPDNMLIFNKITDMSKSESSVDAILLIHKLRGEKEERAAEIVTGLATTFCSSSHFESHVLLLRELAIRRKLREICATTATRAANRSLGVDDTIEELRKGINSIVDSASPSDCTDAATIINDVIKQVDDIIHATGPCGILSGIASVDDLTLGFQPSDLIIVAARPSVGKTAFALNLAVNALKGGHKVGFFSLEMSNSSLGYRLLSHGTGINSSRMRNGHELSQGEWNLLYALRDDCIYQNLYLDETGGLSTNDFYSRARKMVLKKHVEIIFVDYLQLMRVSSLPKNANREQEVAEIAHSLKAAAKNLNIPIVALSQLNRNVDRTNAGLGPQLSDLRESGAIEQDADLVMLLSNNIYMGLGDTANDINKSREIKVNVAKNRNGRIGEVKLLLYPERMTFAAEPAEEIAAPVTYHTFNNIESF